MTVREMVIIFTVVSSIIAVIALLYVLIDWLLEKHKGEEAPVQKTRPTQRVVYREDPVGKSGLLLAAVACVTTAFGAITAASAFKNREKSAGGEGKSTTLRLERSRAVKSRNYHNTGHFHK